VIGGDFPAKLTVNMGETSDFRKLNR